VEKLVLASNGADAEAVVAIERRHTELSTAAAMKTLHLLNTIPQARQDLLRARNDFARWVRTRLHPYLRREAEHFYPALPHSPAAAQAVRDARAHLNEIDAAANRLIIDDDVTSIAEDAIALRSHLSAIFDVEQSRILPYLAFSHQSIRELWELVNA
jgi:hypothetical protein